MFSIPKITHIRTDLDLKGCNDVFKKHEKMLEKNHVPYFQVSEWDEKGISANVSLVKKIYGRNIKKDDTFSVTFRWEGYGMDGNGLAVYGISNFRIWIGFVFKSVILWTILPIMYFDQPWRSVFFWIFVASFNLILLIRKLNRISKLPDDFNACVLFLRQLVDPDGKFKNIKPSPVTKLISGK